ncbi:GNAT family N-acetyltransferase [Maricaulis sp.]|uniref:GNAT family N-acetyltransferase n=1 Tax=Maricaulis sp. TaxID=1486257 RepID=UPI0025BC0B7C|nr:GNAT family N-acetyltransferase [Maricaulis sp.]
MIHIRNLGFNEFDLLLRWAAAEGWNPGLDDAMPFHSADPKGFLVGEINGEPASLISAVRYSDAYGFLGFYICAPAFRGHGHGWAIWHAAMAQLDNHVVGLDGVIDQQDNYRKSGFALAHRNIRHGGTVACETPDDSRLVVVNNNLIPALLEFDRGFVPAPRDAFCQAWLDPSITSRHSLALIEDGEIIGQGTIRKCHDGWKIGPLFARSEIEADLLFRGLCSKAGGETVFLDTPEPNQAALALAARFGLAPVFETARMYRGEAPPLRLDQIFGNTTFELG